MKKIVVWKNIEYFGTEYLEISTHDNRINIESTVISMENNKPYKVNYFISLDQNWVFKSLDIQIDNLDKALHLSSNGQGNWFDEQGKELHNLKGAIDIDLSCTPITNSLPINRLKWQKQTAENIDVVFISVPDLNLKKVQQNYKLINLTTNKKEFQYRSGNFKTNIEVDSLGLVLNYPGIFTRKF